MSLLCCSFRMVAVANTLVFVVVGIIVIVCAFAFRGQ
jgi:hypothetical protein